MAERADGGERSESRVVVVEHQLRGAGVVVHEHAVPGVGDAGAVLDIPHVGPEVVRSGTLCLVRAGIEDEDVVHFAVAVVVIDGQVPVRSQLRNGVDDEPGGVLVFVIVVVGAVIGVSLGQGDDGGDVELERAGVLPLVPEIGDGGGGFGAVHHPVELFGRIGEGQVLELGEDDEPVAERPGIPFRQEAPGPGPFPGLYGCQAFQAAAPFPAQQVPGDVPAGGDDFAGGIGRSGMHARVQAFAVKVEAGVTPPAVRVLGEDAAVGGRDQVPVFVAREESRDGGAVGLGQVHEPLPGRGGLDEKSAGEQYIYDKRPAPQRAGFRFHTTQMTAFFCAFARVHAKNRPHLRETDSLTCTKT